MIHRWTYGIYGIFNRETGRVYVGQSGNIGDRWEQHRRSLQRGKHTNRALQSDWNIYGPSGFEWRVLEQYDIDAGSLAEWNQIRGEREQWWYEQHEANY